MSSRKERGLAAALLYTHTHSSLSITPKLNLLWNQIIIHIHVLYLMSWADINFWSTDTETKYYYLPFLLSFLLLLLFAWTLAGGQTFSFVSLFLQKGSWGGDRRMQWNGAKNGWFSDLDGSQWWHGGMPILWLTICALHRSELKRCIKIT